MLDIAIGTDDLARVRFTTDAIWETAASLHFRSCVDSLAVHRSLLSRWPADPTFDLALLAELTGENGWVPDLLSPVPTLPARPPRARLADVADAADSVVEADLDHLRRTRPHHRAAGMAVPELRERVAEALIAYWSEVLEPVWERVTAITDGELMHRRTLIAGDGLGPTLDGINHRVSFAGNRMLVDVPVDETIESIAGGLWFVPSVFRFPGLVVLWEAEVPVLSYGARGAGLLWETQENGEAENLGNLLGRSRSRVLLEVDVPATTTVLASRLGLAPATVSDHLSALEGAGLLRRGRVGRQVLYERTDLGHRLASRTT